jgi:hypothetical protein
MIAIVEAGCFTGGLKSRTDGQGWFDSLDHHTRWELGDQLVLGSFSWQDWFESKPSPAFMAGVEDARLWFEVSS